MRLTKFCKQVISFILLLVSCVSFAQGIYTSGDSTIDAIFYHPSERPYKKIISNLSRKYIRDNSLSLEEIIQAYPVTAEEFDWFYKTYNPESEYGNYKNNALTFFVYLDKSVKELASSGNCDCLYRVFNLSRFIDIKKNNDLNEGWVLDTGYYDLSRIIESGNYHVVHYLFTRLDAKTLCSFMNLHYYYPDIFQDRRIVGLYTTQNRKRRIEAYTDPIDGRITTLLCDIGEELSADEVRMQLPWLKILPFKASLEEALDKYKEMCEWQRDGCSLDSAQKYYVIFPPEIVEKYSKVDERWYYSKPVLLKSRFEIDSDGKVCFTLFGEAEFEGFVNKKQNIMLKFSEELELQSLVEVLDREKIAKDYYRDNR